MVPHLLICFAYFFWKNLIRWWCWCWKISWWKKYVRKNKFGFCQCKLMSMKDGTDKDVAGQCGCTRLPGNISPFHKNIFLRIPPSSSSLFLLIFTYSSFLILLHISPPGPLHLVPKLCYFHSHCLPFCIFVKFNLFSPPSLSSWKCKLENKNAFWGIWMRTWLVDKFSWSYLHTTPKV